MSSWLITLFPALCVYGAFDIIRGFYTGDLSYTFAGIIIACIGINFSFLSPPNLIILIISGIATFFVNDWRYSVGAGVLLIAVYTAFCLITTMLERNANNVKADNINKPTPIKIPDNNKQKQQNEVNSRIDFDEVEDIYRSEYQAFRDEYSDSLDLSDSDNIYLNAIVDEAEKTSISLIPIVFDEKEFEGINFRSSVYCCVMNVIASKLIDYAYKNNVDERSIEIGLICFFEGLVEDALDKDIESPLVLKVTCDKLYAARPELFKNASKTLMAIVNMYRK